MNDFLAVVGWATSTEPRRRLLGTLILQKGTLTELAGKAGVSKALASQIIGRLIKERIIRKEAKVMTWSDTLQARELKRIINLSRLDLGPIQALPAKSVLLYGSWAEGNNTAESDVDLCVVVKKPITQSAVASVSGDLSRELGTEVHVLVTDGKKLSELKEKSPSFYFNLAYRSILLEGEPIET